MRGGMGQAEALLRSEQSSAQLLLREYAATYQKLNLVHQQLTHLAQRANEAATAYGFKDDELKINALDNEKAITGMNEQAYLDKTELAQQLQGAYEQCQCVVTNTTEFQIQTQANIAMILDENQRER